MGQLTVRDQRVTARPVYAPGDRWRPAADFPYEGPYREHALAVINALCSAVDELSTLVLHASPTEPGSSL